MPTKISHSINRDAIIKVINELPDEFSTKDVSEHPHVRSAHPELTKHSHYHAFIGKYLKNDLFDDSGRRIIEEIASGKSRGSVWNKLSSGKTAIGDSGKIIS